MGNAKGTVLIGPAKYLRTRKEESRKILPEELHHYLEERVSPASWYPESDAIALIRALMQLMPGQEDEVLEGFGVVTARELGNGVYSHLVKDGASAGSTFALWASMHDTGELTVDFEDTHKMVFRLVGYDHTSREMCAIIGSYLQETIRMGGRNASMEDIACTLSGEPACSWRATW